jgi:F0F1-type ATP synthase epsilon subunit
MDGLDPWKNEIEDALTVTGGLQARQARVLADHAEWLQAHDRAMAEAAERDARIDARIEKLVRAIGEFMRRNE